MNTTPHLSTVADRTDRYFAPTDRYFAPTDRYFAPTDRYFAPTEHVPSSATTAGPVAGPRRSAVGWLRLA
jgi:hypothetical protein